MSTKVFNIIIKMTKQGGADKETVQGLINIKNAMTTGMAVAGAMVGAYYAVDKVMDATVGKFVTLAGEVEKFRNQTGMTAEDSSRLLEVMKDLEISAEDVGTAFKIAEKNGFQPNIETLTAMQAQYQSLNPGMERTQFLLKEFGKGGMSLQKFFETGDIAQRLEEVNQAMIISDEGIKSVQEYKDAVDEMKDSWEGFKLSLGQVFLPPVKALLDELNLSNILTRKQQMGLTLLNDAYRDGRIGLEQYNAGLEKQNISATIAPRLVDSATQSYTAMARQAEETAKSNDDLAVSLKDFGTQYSNVTKYAEDYDTSVKDIAAAEKALADLRKSNPMDVEGIKAAEQAVNDLKTAQQRMTDTWMLGIMTQQLSVDGLTTAEMNFLLNYQVDTGLITESARQRASEQWGYVNALIAGTGDFNANVTTTYRKITVNESRAAAEAAGELGSGGGGNEYIPMASGGLFSGGAARVGERGEEWLVRTPEGGVVVLPNDMVRRMSAWGITPGMGFGGGGRVLDDQYVIPGRNPLGPLPSSGSWRPPAVIRRSGGYFNQPAGLSTRNTPDQYNAAGMEYMGASDASGVAAVEAVSPVVAAAVQSFQASDQANTQQVARQTNAVEQASAAQLTVLRSILNAVEGQAEQIAAEIQKRR